MWDSWPTVSLHEVTSDSEGDKYFIFLNKHDRSDDYLKISLLNGIDAYHVEVTRDDIEDMAKRSRIPLSEFEDLAVSALTCENVTKDTFKYNVSRDEQSLLLTWKKVVQEENMNIKLGILSFKIINGANEVWNTLQQLSKYQSERSRVIQELKQERENLQSTNKHLRDILETKVVSKEELEKELFTKFVLVLNKKKEKCREYKEELSSIKSSRKSNAATSEESDSSEVKLTPPKKSKKNTSLLFDDSSDDSMAVHPQRVVKNKSMKRTVQQQEQTKPKTKNRRNCTTPSTTSLTETQDLMDEL